MTRKILLLVLIVLAGLGGFWLLQPSETPIALDPSQTTVLAPQPGPKTLRLAVVGLPPALGNPYRGTGVPTIYTYRAMFEGLTFVTEDGGVEPLLATSWEKLDDLTWQFNLRKDVLFHNGKPFTADAVVFAVDYLTSPAASIEPIARDLGAIESAEAVDDHTVIIRTEVASPLLPALTEALLIVEPEHWKELGREGFAQHPIGTGPFKLVEWTEAKATLDAHREGWRPPKVDKLEIIALPDASSRVQAILSDRIDIAVAMSRDDILSIEAGGGRGDIGTSSSVLGVVFILTGIPEDHPLQDKRVRQALNYAVNKNAYIDALFGGLTKAASQPTTAASVGYNSDVQAYPYDPDKARALLDEAGYGDGFSFTAQVTIGGGASLAPAYQQVSADLLNVGVVMSLRTIPVQQLIRGIQEGEWRGEAFGMNYSAERTTDALRPLRLHSCIHRSPWYCNEEVTAKIEKAFATSDLEERTRLTEDIMASYHDEAAAIWMHEIIFFKALGPKVINFRQDHTVLNYHEIDLLP
ncbi:MAG: ABC transporter substrate-binding protein [Rhodospirillaceae bacterium]